ncbi:serine hydrolase domain-containing protein [Alloiococcus sp. CFN-8]|uniref:serine hydrolase domain-containing protein n=1 Tax=Alloiococcus sp. CFN-8 TaxID=3416081 RepID=UPI003CFA5939
MIRNHSDKAMKKYMVSLIAILIFLGIFTNSAVAANNNVFPSGITYEDIPKEIEHFVENHKDTMGAMEVAIFDKEEVIYENYFGFTDKEKKIYADDNSVFEWGSISKTLIWVSVMQLWEEGLIDLEEDIRVYLPKGFLTNVNYDTPITMINLMNHNAGFQDMLSDLFLADSKRVLSLEEQLKHHMPEQVFKPGEVTAYSNWSSGLAAYIVERISNKSFDEYVRINIFERLGMDHTAIRPDLSDNPWVRERREKLQSYNSMGKTIGTSFYHIALYPAGMVTGTLEDIRTFGQALLQEESNKLVLFKNISTLKELQKATSYYGNTDVPLNHHGFWTTEYRVSVLGHGGNTAGGSSNLLLNLESGIGMVIMTNQANEMPFNHSMSEFVFGVYEGLKVNERPKESIKGAYRSARTILKGPLALYSAVIMRLDEGNLDGFWAYSEDNGIEKITASYGDMLKLSTPEFLFIWLLLILIPGAFFYSLSTLIIGGCIIRPIYIRKRKKQGVVLEKNSFNLWNYLACGAILLWGINLGIIIYQIIGYAPSSYYTWQFALCGLLSILMTVLGGRLIYFWKKIQGGLRRRIKYIITVFFLMIIIIATLYWQMYQFWAV